MRGCPSMGGRRGGLGAAGWAWGLIPSSSSPGQPLSCPPFLSFLSPGEKAGPSCQSKQAAFPESPGCCPGPHSSLRVAVQGTDVRAPPRRYRLIPDLCGAHLGSRGRIPNTACFSNVRRTGRMTPGWEGKAGGQGERLSLSLSPLSLSLFFPSPPSLFLSFSPWTLHVLVQSMSL